MPLFSYRGRDKAGRLRNGERFAESADILNEDLTKEGIYIIDISPVNTHIPLSHKIKLALENDVVHLEELSIFARQMQLLTKSGVPIVTALQELASYTRSYRLTTALNGVSHEIEKGKSLSSAMSHYPDVFTPLVTSIIHIGENTGHLSDSFKHLHQYLEFEAKNKKMIKSTFRYPILVIVAVVLATIILNYFVIPTFAKLYANINVHLPWETRFLIGMSNIFVDYGIYILLALVLAALMAYRYINTPNGSLAFSKFLLRIPIFGRIYKRLILIRFSQSLAITLNSGLLVSQGLGLVKNTINNAYIERQINNSMNSIERGTTFTTALEQIEIFSPLEHQIISVGEKNGEIGPAMDYIGTFQSSEIEFDLKRLNDMLGPILITFISGLVLIIALGIYLPIWNMINLVR